MDSHALRLGRIGGIEVSVHWSWLLIFVLLTWSLATAFFPSFFPFWSAETYWVIAAISTLLLFGSVLAHELSHSLVALSEGIPVRNITLFVFGGVANIQSEPTSAGNEFRLAIAGPLASVAIGALSYAILRLGGVHLPSPVRAILLALAFYNVTLAVFNLVPGFPLDGGRVFRAIVWGITGNFRQATTVATTVGHVFGYLVIFVGLFLAISEGDFLGGMWLVFIGWFLNNASGLSQRQVELESSLRGVTVSRAMRPSSGEVPASTSILDFVEHHVLARNQRAMPVVDDGHLVGLVTLSEVRAVPRERWASTSVGEIMLPVDRVAVARPDEPLIQALRDLSNDDVNQLPVVDHGNLVGLLSRSDVIRYLQIRDELRRPAA